LAVICSILKKMKWINNLKSGWKKRRGKDSLKSFREYQESEAAYDSRDLGIREVEMDKIVGSVGRYHDFDSRFRLKNGLPSERLMNIGKAMREGKPLPPIKLYQIKDEYYIVDGNHRVAAAKAIGRLSIQARILEFLPSRNTLENVLYREKTEFVEKTGLPESIELTEVGQYSFLLEQIEEHKQSLEKVGKTDIAFQDAAKDWYDTIFLPFTDIIERSHLVESFPRRTLADLYGYISFHQWREGSKRKYGIGLDQIIPTSMEDFRAKMAEKKGFGFPEMKRLLTAFVMINVRVGEEYKIMDKLFKMKEVKEIHDVPGEFDLLVKLVMERDWLSSDSEVIGYYVFHHIRKIPGVRRTSTLIPISSKNK